MFIDKKIYEIYPINPTYPDMLKKIPSAPKKIYAIGNISLLNEKSISIVGSRNRNNINNRWSRRVGNVSSRLCVF